MSPSGFSIDNITVKEELRTLDSFLKSTSVTICSGAADTALVIINEQEKKDKSDRNGIHSILIEEKKKEVLMVYKHASMPTYIYIHNNPQIKIPISLTQYFSHIFGPRRLH